MEALNVEEKGHVCIFRFSGELTLEIVDQLKNKTQDYMSSKQYSILVMDLSETPFLDSSGIGFLVQLNNKKKQYNKEFYLYKPTPQVRKTLSLVKLTEFFNFLESEEELNNLIS